MSEAAGAAGAAAAGAPSGTGTSGGSSGSSAPGTTSANGMPPSGGSAGGIIGGTADWTSGFTEELRGYVQNKAFKTPLDVVESYRGAEKLLGVHPDQIVKLPTKADDAEGWNNVYSKLGRPEKASEYDLPMPKEGGDDKFKEWAQNLFHENGLSRTQAQKLSAKWNDYVKGVTDQQSAAHNAQVLKEEGALKTEWGKAFDQNVNMAKRAANELGVKAETIDQLEKVMGFAGVVKLFQNLGSKFGEHPFVSGNSNTGSGFNGALTPAQAKDRLSSLKADPDFQKRYFGGDTIAKDEMARLHSMAYPD